MTEENKVYLYGDSEIMIAVLNARALGPSCEGPQQEKAKVKAKQGKKVGDSKKKKGKIFLYGASDAFVAAINASIEKRNRDEKPDS